MSIEKLIESLGNVLWSVFLPCVIILSIYMSYKFFTKIKKQTTSVSKVTFSQIIGPVAISLGAMIGTGAIIGVLGSLSTLYISGQEYFEAIMGWAVIGAIFLLPLAYIETLVAKTTNMPPKEYIAKFLSSKLAKIYAVCFATMYILGFGGFQFQGINSTITIITNNFMAGSLTEVQRYFFIALPLLLIVSLIVITKKHDLFIGVMAYFIGIAVFIYVVFLIIFFVNTSGYVGEFFSNMINGMSNPITTFIGVPLGMIISFQRIMQTSEPGLGALAMSSLESDSKPRAAGLISIGTSIVTIIIAIFTTTYITSYGVSIGMINLSSFDTVDLLEGFFLTGYDVAGTFGLVVMIIFTILSGITTLLGSYYFLRVLFDLKENTEIAIYISILLVAATLAIFGGAIIFEIVDLLLFVVATINILALVMYVKKWYIEYRIN